MGRSRRRWRALAAVALAAGASVAAFSSSVGPVSGEEPAQQVDEVGLLRLRLSGSTRSLSFWPVGATAPAMTQSITVNAKCGAATAGDLATITSFAGSFGPGLVTNGLGVRQKNTCSSAEGRIGGAETLTFSLGSEFDSDVFVYDAELDVEGKFNASLDIKLDNNVTTVHRTLQSASDNGPDSGVGDNDRIVLSQIQATVAPFREMTLSAPGGEVALEGGGDGSYAQYAAAGKVGPIGMSIDDGTADTIFRLATLHEFADRLSCDETQNAAVIGGSATFAAVTRLDNDGTQDCQGNDDVGVTFEIDDEGVYLDKGTTGVNSGDPQAVNALVEIVWAPQEATVPLPNREINFHPDEDPDDFETVQWCVSWDPVAQTAVHPADARFPGGVLPWCLVDEQIELQSDHQVVQTQLYHGDGDPRWQ